MNRQGVRMVVSIHFERVIAFSRFYVKVTIQQHITGKHK